MRPEEEQALKPVIYFSYRIPQCFIGRTKFTINTMDIITSENDC